MKEYQTKLKGGTTEQHESVSKLCCFCIPHSLGLFILASLKLVLSLAILIEILLTLFLILIFSQFNLIYLNMVLGCIGILISLVDLFIGLVALVSICVEDQGLLGMYYKYTVYVFGSLIVLCCVISFLAFISFFSASSPHILSRHIIPMSIYVSIFLAFLVLQLCLNQMVKREIQILRSNEEFLI